MTPGGVYSSMLDLYLKLYLLYYSIDLHGDHHTIRGRPRAPYVEGEDESDEHVPLRVNLTTRSDVSGTVPVEDESHSESSERDSNIVGSDSEFPGFPDDSSSASDEGSVYGDEQEEDERGEVVDQDATTSFSRLSLLVFLSGGAATFIHGYPFFPHCRLDTFAIYTVSQFDQPAVVTYKLPFIAIYIFVQLMCSFNLDY